MLVRMLVSTRVRNKREQQTGSFLGEASKSKSWRNGMLPLQKRPLILKSLSLPQSKENMEDRVGPSCLGLVGDTEGSDSWCNLEK